MSAPEPAPAPNTNTHVNNPTHFVKLVSADGKEFLLEREAAMVSGTIRSMLSSGFREGRDGVIVFEEFSAPVLEKVCEYLRYYVKYSGSTAPIPEFVIEPEIALDLLMAANYLDT